MPDRPTAHDLLAAVAAWPPPAGVCLSIGVDTDPDDGGVTVRLSTPREVCVARVDVDLPAADFGAAVAAGVLCPACLAAAVGDALGAAAAALLWQAQRRRTAWESSPGGRRLAAAGDELEAVVATAAALARRREDERCVDPIGPREGPTDGTRA